MRFDIQITFAAAAFVACASSSTWAADSAGPASVSRNAYTHSAIEKESAKRAEEMASIAIDQFHFKGKLEIAMKIFSTFLEIDSQRDAPVLLKAADAVENAITAPTSAPAANAPVDADDANSAASGGSGG
jgi:hypothetical protein